MKKQLRQRVTARHQPAHLRHMNEDGDPKKWPYYNLSYYNLARKPHFPYNTWHMARFVILYLLTAAVAGCSLGRKTERPWPPIYRTTASFHQAGSLEEEAEKTPEAAQPAREEEHQPPGLDQVEQAVVTFQRKRSSPGPAMDTAWKPFLEAVSAYLDQPAGQLSFSPLIRARVAAEFELDREQRFEGGAPPELEEAVAVLLGHIDSKARALRALALSDQPLPAPTSGGRLGWPLSYGLITSGFGPRQDPFDPLTTRFHNGVDLAAPPNEPIYAAEAGMVIFAGWAGASGKTVRLRHPRGQETAYGHLSTVLVQEGQEVSRGEVIGLLGRSGRATGHHLHFALFLDGQAVDPLEHLEPVPLGFSDSTFGTLFGHGGEF